MTTIPASPVITHAARSSGKAVGSRIGLDLGMAAAVLVDLALANRITFDDGSIVVTDPTSLWVQIDAHENDVASLKPGTAISIVYIGRAHV